MATEPTERAFDALAKGLAEGSLSRRRALKLFAGTAIAALIPSRALAGGHGEPEKCNDPCICHRPPGNPNNAQTLCIPKKAREAHLKNHSEDSCGPCSGTTTSTTTPTTSTSTSTTSTSTTTPMCIPTGSSSPCTAGGTPCCSGNCNSNGFCCPDGRVGTSNGTCAIPCTSDDECPGFPCGCLNSTEGGLCSAGGSGNFCDLGICASGELCSFGVCFTAC